MIELDFTVPPQATIGNANSTVGIVVSASPKVFPDHDAYVSVAITSIDGKTVHESRERVLRVQDHIDRAIVEMCWKVAPILDRAHDRRMKQLGYKR